jgi:hypothetical protein
MEIKLLRVILRLLLAMALWHLDGIDLHDVRVAIDEAETALRETPA